MKDVDIEFKLPRLKADTVSKIKPIRATVYVIDDFAIMANKEFQLTVYSEVHNNLQDLSATLFRRGVMLGSVVYGPRSIVKVVML